MVSKKRNIAIKLFLQECCKTRCKFLPAILPYLLLYGLFHASQLLCHKSRQRPLTSRLNVTKLVLKSVKFTTVQFIMFCLNGVDHLSVIFRGCFWIPLNGFSNGLGSI